jgi:hypothetical protein
MKVGNKVIKNGRGKVGFQYAINDALDTHDEVVVTFRRIEVKS